MPRYRSSTTCFSGFLLFAIFLFPERAPCQDLVPVNGKREINWGRSSGILPTPGQEAPKNGKGLSRTEPQLDFINLDPQEEEIVGEYSGDLPGKLEQIIQRYPDGKPQVKRQVMQDQAGNFLNHGSWILLNRRGQMLAQGEFRQGLMDGNWERWHPVGSSGLFSEAPFSQSQGPFLSVATFQDGKLHGTWTIFDQHRRKIFEMPYNLGQRDGRAVWYFENSMPMREVDFREGILHGFITEYDRQNKVTRKATFDDGQELITRATHFHKDQKRDEYAFLGPRMKFLGTDDWWNAEPAQYEMNGKEIRHGLSREWYSNGQIRLQGRFQNGSRTGPFTWWHENGQKQIEGNFRNNLKDGRWTWWHANGIKAIQGIYEDDLEQGIWSWWDENTRLSDERNFSEPTGIQDLEALPTFREKNSGTPQAGSDGPQLSFPDPGNANSSFDT